MALASPIYVVNELYVISKPDADNQNDIKNVVNTFYGDESVSDAKIYVVGALQLQAGLPHYQTVKGKKCR